MWQKRRQRLVEQVEIQLNGVDWIWLLCWLCLWMFESRRDKCQRGKSKSSSWLSSSRGKGKSIPSSFWKTTWIVSSTRASSSKRRRVDGSSDGEVKVPLTRKDIPVIVKAVMDAMPGVATHQPQDDVDTVERPGELDDLCCKIVSRIPFCVHAWVCG